MINLKKAGFLPVLFLSYLCVSFSTEAKIRATRGAQVAPYMSAKLNTVSAVDFEKRFRPFFEDKLTHFLHVRQRKSIIPVPDEADFLMLARLWRSLSPEFKSLYVQATQIPDNFLQYVSPGGHFEVYFTKKGVAQTDTMAAVDSTDTFGFGYNGDWKVRISQKNGIPDYVDNVAWALDSVWSMEVERLGYIKPKPFKDSQHPSDRYKVVIINQGPTFYGMTYVEGKDQADSIGYQSYIEINNDWSSSEWNDLGYNIHPENGARVTCAHEFFHAIQYAMSRQVVMDTYLDDYPLSWLEGTSVLMEELAFDSINDYIQYSDDFFNNPKMSFMDEVRDSRVYSNSLLTKFLHEFYQKDANSDFIKNMFFNNYAKLTSFRDDILLTCRDYSVDWADLINSFHTRSFFTGVRSVKGMFIADAPLLNEWTFTPVALDKTNSVRKRILPYGMEIFSLNPGKNDSDTLTVFFNGSMNAKDSLLTYPTWAASCIMRRPIGNDTIKTIPVSLNTGIVEVPQWRSLTGVVVIASNGLPGITRSAMVSFQACPVTYAANTSQTFIKNASMSSIRIALTTGEDLRCSLTMETVQDSITALLVKDTIAASSDLFEISFPQSWTASGSACTLSMTFSVRCNDSLCGHLKESVQAGTAGLYFFDQTQKRWISQSASLTDTQDSLNFNVSLLQPGIYGILRKSTIASVTGRIVIYPNPVRQNSGAVRFNGDNIDRISIYSVEGAVVTSLNANTPLPLSFKKELNEYVWTLRNTSDRKVMPGLYSAIVTTKDPDTGITAKYGRKILVVP